MAFVEQCRQAEDDDHTEVRMQKNLLWKVLNIGKQIIITDKRNCRPTNQDQSSMLLLIDSLLADSTVLLSEIRKVPRSMNGLPMGGMTSYSERRSKATFLLK